MKRLHIRTLWCLLALGWLLWPASAQAATPQVALTDAISDVTLGNGLRVIMVKTGTAPVINFNLMFDVGGVDEPAGLGGIAHMVEHMAFKGTKSIGSYDVRAEERALETLEQAAQNLVMARAAGASEGSLEPFEAAFEEARAAAQELASPNALDTLFTNNGAQGLNASTGYDRTSYVVSLPSNRLELYARIYADVLKNVVFRAFYEERDVVREERRQRSEDSPDGVLYEAFLREAFKTHPYGRPLIGDAAEIEGYTATGARSIFDVFYHPNRAVLVLVGDVEPERDIRIIRSYFGTLAKGPVVRAEIPAEPEQQAERRISVPFDAEPQLVVGYRKPTYPAREAYVMDVLDYVLGKGRSSRLYKRLVTDERLAVNVSSSSATPGTRYPNLFTVELIPRAPHTPEALEAALYDELEKIKAEGVREGELARAKRLLRADVLRSFSSGPSLAAALAYNELFAGSWENLFSDLDLYDTVSSAEIQEAAARIFTPSNRTVATLVPRASASN